MTRFSSETRGGCAIVLRLQDRGAPAGAAPLRVAVLAALGHRPKPFFAVAVPATLESPGRAVRGTPVHRAKGPPDPWQCPGSPVAWAFAGTIPALCTPCCAWAPAQAVRGLGVRRDERPPDARLVPAHPPDCCLAPAHPPDTRLIPAHPLAPWQVCGAPRAGPFGRENCHGHLSFRGLTPAGSVPASRGWQRSQIKLLGRVWARGVYGSEQPGIASMDKPDKIA